MTDELAMSSAGILSKDLSETPAPVICFQHFFLLFIYILCIYQYVTAVSRFLATFVDPSQLKLVDGHHQNLQRGLMYTAKASW